MEPQTGAGHIYIRPDGLWVPFVVENGQIQMNKEDLAFYHIKDDTVALCEYPPVPDFNCGKTPVIISNANGRNLTFSMSGNESHHEWSIKFFTTRVKFDTKKLDEMVEEYSPTTK